MMVVGGIVVPEPVLVKRGPRSVIRAGTFWAQVFGSIDSQGTRWVPIHIFSEELGVVGADVASLSLNILNNRQSFSKRD